MGWQALGSALGVVVEGATAKGWGQQVDGVGQLPQAIADVTVYGT